ncbi:MAG: RNA polymerase sigma factor [Gemmatimonadota bacterium]
MEERALVERAKAGDRFAMGRLYEVHARRVYTVVRRLAGDDHLAEDLAQDAWVRAFEKLHLFRGEAAFGTWMYRLATNVALNRLRRQGRRTEVEGTAEPRPGLAHPDEALVNRRALALALDRLPPGYRRVLVLHDVEGWTHEEIASALKVTAGTSKSQLHKARARMREMLAPSLAREGEEVGNDV